MIALQQSIEEIQKLIEKLDGVLAAKVVPGENGELQEIHVLADRSRAAKQLSRDIESALAAGLGLTVEHRIISIAQIGDEIPKAVSRIRVESVEIANGVDGFSARVTLNYEDRKTTGSANGYASSVSRYGTVARACLDALRPCLHQGAFSVSEVLKLRIANADEINVAVSFLLKDSERLLTGTALIHDDEYYAIVRATLSAVNRVLPMVIS